MRDGLLGVLRDVRLQLMHTCSGRFARRFKRGCLLSVLHDVRLQRMHTCIAPRGLRARRLKRDV